MINKIGTAGMILFSLLQSHAQASSVRGGNETGMLPDDRTYDEAVNNSFLSTVPIPHARLYTY